VLSWTVADPATDEGEIAFLVPTGLLPGTYTMVVTNSVGSNPGAFGFTVNPPEIVPDGPIVGKAGDPIAIRGNFFGAKKGKVYLGYEAKGKPTKKICSVLSWTVVDPVTDEGEIVFVVPGGLPPGAYDLIVTNGVGSDTEPGLITIQ